MLQPEKQTIENPEYRSTIQLQDSKLTKRIIILIIQEREQKIKRGKRKEKNNEELKQYLQMFKQRSQDYFLACIQKNI